MRVWSILFVATVLACSSQNGALDPMSTAGSGGKSEPVGGSSGASGSSAQGGGGLAGQGGSAIPGAGSGGTISGVAGSTTSGAGGTGATGGAQGMGGAITGQVGVWENVTPAGMNLDFDYVAAGNYGVMDVLADPVRPADFYVGVCYQGFWRSTDFGATWNKVSTGSNGSVLDGGRPWSAAIDKNKNRDPSSAPALYTTDGYGSQNAVFKSTDWGVNWTVSNALLSPYSFDMDPYDSDHLVTGLHEDVGIAESTDGGANFTKHATGAIGKSIYPFFIDTGDAATTRKTWLAVPQQDSGTAALTTDGGTTFNPVGGFSHPHGGNQLFNAGSGVAFIGGSGGVWRTQDSGASFVNMYDDGDYPWVSGVVGTETELYSWLGGAVGTGIGDPHYYQAARDPGSDWTSLATPEAMNNGAKSAAVSADGDHYVIVSGNWNAGLWRYIEP